jgi:hypothetical protein
MPKKPSKNPFERISARQITTAEIVDLKIQRADRRARVERNDAKGELIIYWPNDNAAGGISPINASYLLQFPELSEPFTYAFVAAGKKKNWAISTANRYVKSLREGFCAFLASANLSSIGVSDITTTLLNGFVRWLNRTKEDGTSMLAVTRREQLMTTLRKVLIDGLNKTAWATRLRPDLQIPANIWAGQTAVTTKMTPTIPHSDFRMIYQACLREITEIMADVYNMRQLMDATSAHPIVFATTKQERDASALATYGKLGNRIPNPYRDLGVCLAVLKHRYAEMLVDMLTIEEGDASLAKAVAKFHGGWKRVSRCFHPSPRELMPFLLMMAIHLFYNLETLLASKVGDYRIKRGKIGREEFEASLAEVRDPSVEDAEEEVFEGQPEKKRARGKRQKQTMPATNDIDNPACIYRFLLEWTRDTRISTAPHFRSRLFVFLSGKNIEGFDSNESICGRDGRFRKAYEAFFKDNNIPYHNFRMFRATGMDIVDIVHAGDIRAKQAAGNHAKANTTYQKYSTSGQMERGDEELAEVRLVHERWRVSNRAIDPRSKPEGSDRGATTPGWRCVDPFDPPSGQPNTLCNDYGKCPDCHHGYTDPDSAYSCAQAWNLLAAIDQAASEIAPDAWLTRWAPVKRKLLEVWLPRFSTRAQEAAKTYRLHPLPPLE